MFTIRSKHKHKQIYLIFVIYYLFTLKLQTIQTFKIQLKMKCVDLIGKIDFDLLIDY